MKKSEVIVLIIVIFMLVFNGFAMFSYYNEIAYPISNPTNFEEINEDFENCVIVKEYEREFYDVPSYLIETRDGNQKLLVLDKFPYLDKYQLVCETDVPNTRPCTISIDFLGKEYDFTIDEENELRFNRTNENTILDIASPVFLLMPIIYFSLCAIEAGVGYLLYVMVLKKKSKCA